MDTTFTNETIVNLPRDKTASLYVDIQYFPEWQKNFISHKLLNEGGTATEVAEVSYNIAGKTLTFIRKVLKSDLPKSIVVTFEIEGVRQIVVSEFMVVNDEQCKLVSTVTISSTSTVVQAIFEQITTVFQAQTTFMQSNFKRFAENFDDALI